jgi:hypothetical protein
LFLNKGTIPLKCVFHELNILNAYSKIQNKQDDDNSKEVEINKTIPWDLFDGASQEAPPMGG